MFIFSSKLRRKLFGYLFTHAHERFYAAELAHLIHEDTANVFRELRDLEKEGVFSTSVKGRIKLFELNKKYPLYNELRQIVSKTVGVEGSLLQIIKKYPDIKTAFIYGSYAKNNENAASDIDLLIVGKVPEDKFTDHINALERKINREINFSTYSPEEYKKSASARGSFQSEVLKGPRIILKESSNDR